ncbi:MFS siderochrome iron transporter 1 [Purpureocillium takamizusanense]|uniref:MFS siderochrome iron transporter 1 n=1 Tax=Purpureocillium takamizusanense TaxID=2060973 RepID=A0A9Q8QBF4_9HYPO|nr:MFS siderochrome iron transporter 1 [Purpureocillium takamizusanense]UNI16182.1 MFS siderochrome iron transporter 1 [Purpureocillium takamizusanense]
MRHHEAAPILPKADGRAYGTTVPSESDKSAARVSCTQRQQVSGGADTYDGDSSHQRQQQQHHDEQQDRLLDDGQLPPLQAGVQSIEATTTAWTQTALVAAYAMIWVIYFVNTTQQGATSALTPWVTSAFQQHSLTPTVALMSQIVGGVFKLTLAKILDVFGRPQGYLLAVVLTTLGLAAMAACRNVETYAAAQVFYWVGFNGLDYCLSIFVADTSSLRNRGLVFAFSSSPYMVTAWLSGPISEAFLNGPGFRWGFATFAVVTPVVALPLYFLFMHNYHKAKRRGLIPERKHGQGPTQTFVHYAQEFDLVGVLLLSIGLALFLLPFNIYSRQELGWRSPMIVSFLVTGIVLLVLFALWEWRCAPVKFIPYSLLMDRTVFGACILACVSFTSYYIWDSYFNSFLQVVNGLSVTQASYVGQVYSVGTCLWALVVGLLIRKTGRFKWLALYVGVPLLIVGVGLMIRFRQPNVHVGWLVMCQALIAVAGGTIVICEQTAVMAAAASHQFVAVVLAVESMFAALGAAIGLTVAAAIWQAVFPRKLREYLPASELGNLDKIYGRLDVQLSYPVGSPARIAIQRAYGDGQRMMLLGGTSVLIIALVAVAMWRDINVKSMKQVRGNVI